MGNCRVVAIANAKGGVAKSTTCNSLAIGLTREGKRVLCVDADPQASLTISLGYRQPDALPIALSDILTKIMDDKPLGYKEGILHHEEGVDLMASNIALSGLEMRLFNMMNRERVLKQFIDGMRPDYDYILIDCLPSLGLLAINALTAADSVLIPVQAQFLPLKGLELLLQTIGKVRRHTNPNLHVEGILLTMADFRTNNARVLSGMLRDSYGSGLRIFATAIPYSVRAAETSAMGKSIYTHDPKGKVAEAYRELTREVLNGER